MINNAEKVSKTTERVLNLMLNDDLIGKNDEAMFNKMCMGCDKDCEACFGFSLSCIIDNLVAVAEGRSGTFNYSLKEYRARKKFVDDFKSANGGRMFNKTADKGHTLDDVIRSRFNIAGSGSGYDVLSKYFNAKKSGRAEIDGFRLPPALVGHIKNNFTPADIGNLTLIGVIVSSCGIYGVMLKDEIKSDNTIVPVVRSMALLDTCLLFNHIEDKRRVFHPISPENTVVFNEEQIVNAICLNGYEGESAHLSAKNSPIQKPRKLSPDC